MKCPTCDTEVSETSITCIDEEIYCSICIRGKEAREARLDKIMLDGIRTAIECKVNYGKLL